MHRSRGPRGFFCLQVVRRVPVIVDVIRLKSMYFYTAHRRLTPASGEDFTGFVKWSGFDQIDEFVSSDSVICPNLVTELTREDWDYNVSEDNRVFWFRDHVYLRKRIDYNPTLHNILSLVKTPSEPITVEPGFEFCGYDILDSYDSISVLTDCGGFPDVFEPSIVNRYALLDSRLTADQIASTLRSTHPDCDHCRNCAVWSVARLKPDG